MECTDGLRYSVKQLFSEASGQNYNASSLFHIVRFTFNGTLLKFVKSWKDRKLL